LYASLARQLDGLNADILSAQIGRILVWWLDVRRDVLAGDRVKVIYRTVDGPGRFRVLALTYHSNKRDRNFQAYYYKPSHLAYGRYYNALGKEIESRLKHSPLADYEQITELMNLAGRRHHGVDFKTDVGTAVLAPFRAQVLRRNWKTRNNGQCLELLDLDTGRTALFLHLNSVSPHLKTGQQIQAGTMVARSGNTGRSTAPHLHYEIHSPKGQLLNPFLAYPSARQSLPKQELASFFELRKELDAHLRPKLSDAS
jgi:murein DD-endopeptidase MepM/ murein hydrolase activator NlpD